jgi:hypothetical protein
MGRSETVHCSFVSHKNTKHLRALGLFETISTQTWLLCKDFVLMLDIFLENLPENLSR